MIVVPFYPIVAKDRGIEEFITGLVFMTCPFFSVLSSIQVSKIIQRIGCRSIVAIGMLSEAIALLGMTLCNSLDNVYFIILSFLSRALAGFGVACIYIANLTTISLESGDQSDSHTSMMEAFGGTGLMLAPIYASIAYSTIGFSGLFFVLGILLLFFLPFVWAFSSPMSQGKTIKKEYIRGKFTKNMAIDLSILVYCYGTLCFLEPILGVFLLNIGMSENFIGFVFTMMTLSYTVTNFTMSYLSQYVKLKNMVCCSAGMCSFGLFISGPLGDYYQFPWIFVLGAVFVGIGVSLGFVSVLPSMLSDQLEIGLGKDSDNEISGLFSMSINLGEILGPVISGIFINLLTFNSSCSVLSLLGIILVIISKTLKTKNTNNTEVLLGNSDIEL
jgi:MFS family permease